MAKLASSKQVGYILYLNKELEKLTNSKRHIGFNLYDLSANEANEMIRGLLDQYEAMKGFIAKQHCPTLKPLLIHENILANKLFPYNFYAVLVCISKIDEQAKDNFDRYILKAELLEMINSFYKFALEKEPPSERTIRRQINKLKKWEPKVIKEEGDKYRIRTNGANILNYKFLGAYELPSEQIITLLKDNNRNMLRLYLVICINTYIDNELTPLDRKALAEKMGMSINSERELKIIGKMANKLADLDYIDLKQEKGKPNLYKVNMKYYDRYLDDIEEGRLIL